MPIKLHLQDLKTFKIGKGSTKCRLSVIYNHLLQGDSHITIDDFDILVSDSNKFKLLMGTYKYSEV